MTAPSSAWKPGQSGNPGGRPKEIGHVRDLARQYTPEAIETLATIMRNGKLDASRIAAAEALLDRAWGRPTNLAGPEDVPGGAHATAIILESAIPRPIRPTERPLPLSDE